jgi:hypothetical protein
MTTSIHLGCSRSRANAVMVSQPLSEITHANTAEGVSTGTSFDTTGNDFGSDKLLARSYTTKSMGGFANVRLADGWLAGVDASWTTRPDAYLADGTSANDHTTHLQGLPALRCLLARQLYLRTVHVYASARSRPRDVDVPVWNDTMYSGRIRLMYFCWPPAIGLGGVSASGRPLPSLVMQTRRTA